MKKIILFTLAALLVSISNAQEINKLWELEGLEAPESVVYHNNHFYVSNVSGQPAEKNGQGFISKLNQKGEVVQLKWVVGFNAPKGLGIFQNKLYVADIDELAVIDLPSATIEKRFKAEGATFLNDVEIDANGTVYVTDTFGGNAIYQLKNNQLDLLLKDERLDYPNGLKIQNNTLYVSTWGVVTNPETFETEIPGALLAVDLQNKSITKIAGKVGNLDGLIQFNDGFITSDWIAGKIIFINPTGETQELIDVNAGSADIEYLEDKHMLLVPQMLDGKLVAYEVK